MSANSTARDVFMYLLVVVVPAMSAVALGSLLFDLINVYLPDPALQKCWYDSCANGIRTSIAVLMVAFPVLLWAWRFIRRDVKAHPEKADLTIRRWLLYFTLFVAGVVVIGDLIALINNWLQGELTVQFALKILVVLFIASATFYYFLRELHPEKKGHQNAVAWTATVVVLAAVVLGFVTAGSPASARDRRIDDQRVAALQQLQYQLVDVYWTGKGRLPQSLAELQDPVSGFMLPRDPEAGEGHPDYEYIRKGERQFALCATFAAASTVSDRSEPRPLIYPVMPGMMGSWDHEAGRVCFDRTIDPQLYPIRK